MVGATLRNLVVVGLALFSTTGQAAGTCEGVDFNADGVINDVDVEFLATLLGKSEGDAGYVAAADLDGSGSITPIDFRMMLSCR